MVVICIRPEISVGISLKELGGGGQTSKCLKFCTGIEISSRFLLKNTGVCRHELGGLNPPAWVEPPAIPNTAWNLSIYWQLMLTSGYLGAFSPDKCSVYWLADILMFDIFKLTMLLNFLWWTCSESFTQ